MVDEEPETPAEGESDEDGVGEDGVFTLDEPIKGRLDEAGLSGDEPIATYDDE